MKIYKYINSLYFSVRPTLSAGYVITPVGGDSSLCVSHWIQFVQNTASFRNETLLTSDSLNHSFKRFAQKGWFIQELNKLAFYWVTESFIQPILRMLIQELNVVRRCAFFTEYQRIGTRLPIQSHVDNIRNINTESLLPS